MEQISLDWSDSRTILTVSELNESIRDTLGKQFGNVWVAGEISGIKAAASGHLYFTLKDRGSQIRCVCFRSALRWLRFKPADGIAVVARGKIDVYEPRGEYQMLVEHLEPQGVGALQLAFDELKKKLDAEGLFAIARKRTLPVFPRRIGIVTSPTGAVIRDVIEILTRRFPGLHLRLYPAAVQGAGSVEQVVAGIRHFSRTQWADVVIVCRGGGSLEDLWTFNVEAVARAIAECAVPVVSAVGHETDFTIADFVADLRAPTPSAAAEMVIRPKEQFVTQVNAIADRLERATRLRLAAALTSVHRLGFEQVAGALGRRIGRFAQRVDECEFRLRERLLTFLRRTRRRLEQCTGKTVSADPRVRLAIASRRLQAAQTSAAQVIRLRLTQDRQRVELGRTSLMQLSPLTILDRGYAIATDDEGKILRDSRDTSAGQTVKITLSRGRIGAQVVETDAG